MDLLSKMALAMTPGLGPSTMRKLVAHYGDADIFALPPSELIAAFGPHRQVADSIIAKSAFPRAEEELLFCQRGGLHVLFFTDEAFPQRLNSDTTPDAPVLLYVQGDADLNAGRSVSVVGTRRATAAGRDTTARLVSQMLPFAPLVVSGLAYGIDSAAHTAAVECGLPTVAVLGHGLDRIYPASNRHLAEEILAHGGALVTEYPSGTAINPRLFPARNRIVAAMGDATVVVEASEKGGALITAAIATSYCREVFAVPGRLTDTYSCGTNNLIATDRATLLRSADDLAYHLGWPLPSRHAEQQQLFRTLTADEQAVVDAFGQSSSLRIDDIAGITGRPMAKVAALLFNLEMDKVVRPLPGNRYELVG